MSPDDLEDNAGSSSARKAPSDIFKILVATDIHLGYGEKDANIGNDFFGAYKIVKLIN